MASAAVFALCSAPSPTISAALAMAIVVDEALSSDISQHNSATTSLIEAQMPHGDGDGDPHAGKDTKQAPKAKPIALMTTRGYQQEMLDASLKQNIIIALDTGSGKTHIAILRMKHELERQSAKVRRLVFVESAHPHPVRSSAGS